MSLENVETVRRGFEHFRRTRDFFEDDYASEFVWDMSKFRGWPEQQTYEGVEGTRMFIRDWTGAFDDWRVEVESLHDAGEKVVAVCRQRGRAKVTGLPVEMRMAQVWTLRDGARIRMEMYADPAEALEAVGLQ